MNSPLPPRKIKIAEPDEQIERVKVLEPVEGANPVESVSPTTLPVAKKKIDTKKIVIFGAIGAGIILLLFIIFGVIIPGSKNKNKIVTLNYWGLWEDSPVMSGIIADFEAKNPTIKVNYKMNSKTDYRSRLIGRLNKTGDSEDVPDIYRLHSTWLPMFSDYLAPVPVETVKKLELDTDFYEIYKNSLKEGGQYKAIPLMYDGLALFYNKDLINAGGVSLPKSWWDLKSAAEKLTVKDVDGRIQTAGVAMGLVDNVDQWSDILGLMIKQNGVNPLSNNPDEVKKLKDVLTFYTMFRTSDNKVWDESLPNSTQLFASGKLAFYFGQSWRVFNINDLNPNLNYGIMTVPQLPTLDNTSQAESSSDTQLTNIHWANYWAEGINSKSKNQKEAWKFMEYLASKEAMEKMYTAASQTRAFGEIYPRKSLSDKIINNEKTKAFVSVADKATTWYLASNTWDGGLDDAMAKYFGDAINSLALKSLPMEEVIVALQNGINQVKTTYQLK
ncbi:MAG: extracellular solute-binding protein [Candidatus Shapirobacteria bacterium]